MKYIFLLSLFILSCTKPIELDLPEYESKLVVECYLDPGKPMTCLLQESMLYTAEPGLSLINDAFVTITHNGIIDTLKPQPGVDLLTGRAYNYISDALMTKDYGTQYFLHISDSKGRVLAGSTMLLPEIPIDSVFYTLEDDNEYRLYCRISDPADSDNYYRHITTKLSLTDSARTDFLITDNTFNGEVFEFFTFRSDFLPGDSALSLVFNIPEDYYFFLRSVEDAKDANGNPFGQPSVIRSNVTGGIGIFTALSYSAAISIAQ